MILSTVIAGGVTIYIGRKIIYKNKKKRHLAYLFQEGQVTTPDNSKGNAISSSLSTAKGAVYQVSEKLRAVYDMVSFEDSYRRQLKALLATDNGKERQARRFEKEIDQKLAVASVSLGLASAGPFLHPLLSWLSVPGLLYVTRDIFKSASEAYTKERRLTVDVPILIVTVLCIAKGYFFLCTLNAFFAMYSRKLLANIKDKSQKSLVDVFRVQPRSVWVLTNGIEIERSLSELQAGDVLVVGAGQIIPVDGCITLGLASVDQHILTGEARPVEKEAGDDVFAMTTVLSGKIHIEVIKAGSETTAAQIGELLNQTINFKTDRQLWIEETGNRAVLPMLILSGATLPFLNPIGSIALLNTHPKYKTTIATYIGLLGFLRQAAQRGLLIKDGRTIEHLTEVDTVVFDKTGTLTEEVPHVGHVYLFADYEENDILAYAAAAEHRQSHPIAKAIRKEASTRSLSIPEIHEAEYKVGYGLTVMIDNQLIRVGSLRFMNHEGIPLPAKMQDAETNCRHHGHSLVVVAIGTQIIGAIELHVTLRAEVQAVIEGLRQRGINSIYLISGDHETPTRQLAQHLGFDHYFAETLPEQKAKLIVQLQEEGKSVCFVGDGINDSIALKQADVSISLRGASTAATDIAQIVLMDGQLDHLCDLFDLAQEFESNMKRTFLSVLTPHFVGFGGALLLGFGFGHTILLNQFGLLLGVVSALEPQLASGSFRRE